MEKSPERQTQTKCICAKAKQELSYSETTQIADVCEREYLTFSSLNQTFSVFPSTTDFQVQSDVREITSGGSSSLPPPPPPQPQPQQPREREDPAKKVNTSSIFCFPFFNFSFPPLSRVTSFFLLLCVWGKEAVISESHTIAVLNSS